MHLMLRLAGLDGILSCAGASSTTQRSCRCEQGRLVMAATDCTVLTHNKCHWLQDALLVIGAVELIVRAVQIYWSLHACT
jgi:hypothetical protein